jgi:molybdopterin/thiamine biosynthesis adenylyltransferase
MKSQRENGLMLARLLGTTEDDACARLDRTVLITHGSGNARMFARDLKEMLERTLAVASLGDTSNVDIEVIAGAKPSGRTARRLYVTLDDSEVIVTDTAPSAIADCHPLFRAVAACYAAGMVISKAVDLDKGQGSTLHVRFASLGVSAEEMNSEIVFGDTVLVGAGAVGNGFLRALRHINVSGTLVIADPKVVSEGNINRCLYFDESDVRKPKAVQLASKARRDFPRLVLEAYQGALHRLVDARGRVRRVFTAVDSRGARRSTQMELPLEVIDASTTAADEIITHSSRFPTDAACLACIYAQVEEETGRNQDIADGLGVTLDDVGKGFIEAEVAERISAQHKDLDPQRITGMAYDSLFKERCAADLLLLPGGDQILAPFAFVSCLAGALMVIELLRFDSATRNYGENYFFTSPWRAPYLGARSRRLKNTVCQFCSKPKFVETMENIWADILRPKD